MEIKPSHRALNWLLFALPFLLLGLWMRQYAFQNFMWDDWGLIQTRFPTDDMKPSWEGLFDPISGHRIPLLKFSIIPLFLVADGDPRVLAALSILIAIITALLLIRLARKTLTDLQGGFFTVSILIISLAIASPIFGHAWQWWICWINFVPFVCFAGAAVLLSNPAEFSRIRLVAALFLSILAPLAHASGAVVWMALVPLVWEMVKDRSRNERLTVFLVWGAVGLAIVWPFLTHAGEAQVQSELSLGESIVKLLSYTLAICGGNLGQGLSDNPLTFSRGIGVALALIFGAIVIRCLRRWSDRELRARLVPWISISLFGFLGAAAIAFGRSNLPDEQALGGRYLLVSSSIYLGVWFCLLELFSGRSTSKVPRAGIVAATVIISLQVTAWLEGFRIVRWNHAVHQARVACVNFIRVFPDNPALRRCWPDLGQLVKIAERLDAADKLQDYRLYRTNELKEIGRYRPLPPIGGGHVTSASTESDGSILIEGYAAFPEEDKPADLILLSRVPEAEKTDPGKNETIFCLVPMQVPDDFYDSHERHYRPEKFSRWKIRLSPDQFPKGRISVGAWAFDHDRKRIHILRNRITLVDGVLTEFDREVSGRENEALDAMWPAADP